MRFADRIIFTLEEEGKYNPKTGKHDESTFTREIKPCHLSTLKMDRVKELFGEIDKCVIIARLQRPYKNKFSYIEIGNDKYNVLNRSDYRKGVLYLERRSI